MDTIVQDLRYALRTLLRTPTLTVAAIACLALGIGANATIFGVVDTLLLRPPAHVQNPDDVVRLYFRATERHYGTHTSGTTGYPLYTALRDSAHAFQSIAAFSHDQSASLGRGADAKPMRLVLVSSTFFPLLGVRPALGRFFGPDEDRQGAVLVVVLSHAFWRRQFGGDSTVLGRPLALSKSTYTVVGVAPPGFTGVDLRDVDGWVPIAAATPDLMGPSWLTRGSMFLQTIGRLRAGVSRVQAAHEATLVFRAEDALTSHPDSTATALLGPIQAARGPDMGWSKDAQVATWLAVVAAIVLLVACANVVNILLARAVQRQREIAIRRAIGAGRGDLARQLLTESALLALAGAGGALLVASWTGPVIRAFLLGDVPAAATTVDVRVLVFTGTIALLVGVLTGLAPALQVGRDDLIHALKSGAGEGRFQRSKLRSLLLVGQVALTLALLVGAGLFARSLRNVRRIDLGFDADHILRATIDLKAAGFGTAEANALYMQMLQRVQRLPAVEHAAASVGSPFGWGFARGLKIPGRDSLPRLKTGGPYRQAVTASYFAAMGTPVRGRDFTSADQHGQAAIVNETFARAIWPGENPIGKCLQDGDRRAPCSEIIGVVPDAHRNAVVEDAAALYYVPLSRREAEGITALVVRARGRPEDLVEPVRREMQSAGINLPFASVVLFADRVDRSIRTWRLGTTMFGLFAQLALILTAVGLYGVLAYTVGQRTHELGVRIALGAQRADVVRLVVAQGVRVAGLGVAVGAVLALAGGRAVAALLYGVSPHDPPVLGAAGCVLLAVAALASWLPARRAARVDPMVALRTE
jgi:putative ABC transport system permease protein